MASLKGNIVLNVINTLTGILFPVITFPYAARILLPEGIGTVNFLNSVVWYLVLLTSLGIPLYAVREIAKHSNDKGRRDHVAMEILVFSLLLCVPGYLIVWALASWVPQIAENAPVFFVLSLAILFTNIGVQWFYQGIEDFRFITIRAVVVRTVTAACLFIFVRTPADIMAYAAITVGVTVGNNIVNFVHLRKHVDLRAIAWRNLDIWRHARPAFNIFVLTMITSIYLNLNSVMLGFMKDSVDVGYYTAGNKISHMVLTVITSLSAVMIPRCSSLISQGKMDEFADISRKAMQLVVATALPTAVGLILFAAPLIMLFCGAEFMEAVPVLQWTAPVVLVISMSSVIGLQILYPCGKEKIVIISALGGAAANIFINLLLIPQFSYVGVAIGTLGAETAVTAIQIFVGRKYIPFGFERSLYFNYVVASALSTAAAVGASLLLPVGMGMIAKMSVGIAAFCVVYFFTLSRMDDPMYRELLAMLRKKL